MKRFLSLMLLFGALAPAAAADKAAAKDNTPPEGFTALFNGTDLTNWQGLVPINERAKLSGDDLVRRQKEANEKYLPHWTVNNGVIEYDGKGNNLQTVKDYGNFELYVDWKIPPKGDSGIYLRGNPQVQIWESDTIDPKKFSSDFGKGSGGLWNNPAGSKGKEPLVKADNPTGEWNTFHIIMIGDKVTVFLNDKKVVDEAPLANYWDKDKPLPTKGPIELQHHGDKLWFKNIYIKELSDGQPPRNDKKRAPTRSASEDWPRSRFGLVRCATICRCSSPALARRRPRPPPR
jgi:hypothetical protein